MEDGLLELCKRYSLWPARLVRDDDLCLPYSNESN